MTHGFRETTQHALFLRLHVYAVKKNWQKHRETGVAPRWSDRICRISGPHRRSRSLILITRLLLWPTIYRWWSASSPIQSVLRPTCITRYLISSVSTIVTGVDPDTPPSTNCGSAPPRSSSICELRAANWLAIRDTIARRNILRSARARGGVTRSTRKVADDPRYTAVLTRNP